MGYSHDETCLGAQDGCGGCDECIEVVSETTFRVARKARGNILPGDLVKVTKGFRFQTGGKRLGYFGSEALSGYGPSHGHLAGLGWPTAHRPVLTRKGFQVVPAPALPPEAVEREALAARVQAMRVARPATVAGALAGVEEARALVTAIEAYLAGLPAEVAPVVRSYLERGYHTTDRWAPPAPGLVAMAEGRVAHLRKREEAAAWEATGLAWREAGEVITAPDGKSYRLGKRWSRWVAHSSMEYYGHSVDGEVVSGRSLLDPDTGAVVLRWRRGDALPHQGRGL